MKLRLVKKLVAPAIALAALTAREAPAEACGGCIHPNETPTVVTDHRMIFTVSKEQSTLYDQISYSGSPSSFGWVLPVVGDVSIGVSADGVFGAIDARTATQIYAPPINCPVEPEACRALFARDGGAVQYSNGGGVTVLRREVVGPYDTALLKASSPAALETWAKDNAFVIPEEAKPVIAAYQAEHFDFLAVKLVPGAGVKDMRPIRVTTKGANVALPLRMVAVGAGATLGITLWVLSEGRMEPTNFGWFTVPTEELVWDWTANKSNYVDLRAAKAARAAGRMWEIESSITIPQSVLRDQVRQGTFDPGGSGTATSPDYEPSGNKSAAEVQDEDLAALFAGLPADVRVTRMRADLTRAALDQDLTLGASTEKGELSNVRTIRKEAQEPLCPVYRDCQVVGQAPRSQAAAQTAANPNAPNDGGDDDDGCSTTRSREGANWLVAMLGLFAFTVRRKLRRRRR